LSSAFSRLSGKIAGWGWPAAYDFIVDRFQFLYRAAMQDDRGVVGSEGQGCGFADALARTRDENDAALQ